MELSEYTDEQLKDELKRRAALRIRKTLEEHKGNFTYWEGTVVNFHYGTWGGISTRYVFTVEADDKSRESATLLVGAGFRKANMPKVGDRVMLRYRNGNGLTCNIAHSKIIQIIQK